MTPDKLAIPDTAAGGPDTGLVRKDRQCYATFYRGGRRARRLLGKDLAPREARRLRDLFYADLAAAGATVAVRGRKQVRGDGDRREKVLADPGGDLYIQHRQPWVFKIEGRVIAEGATEEEVRRARDDYFKVGKGGGR